MRLGRPLTIAIPVQSRRSDDRVQLIPRSKGKSRPRLLLRRFTRAFCIDKPAMPSALISCCRLYATRGGATITVAFSPYRGSSLRKPYKCDHSVPSGYPPERFYNPAHKPHICVHRRRKRRCAAASPESASSPSFGKFQRSLAAARYVKARCDCHPAPSNTSLSADT